MAAGGSLGTGVLSVVVNCWKAWHKQSKVHGPEQQAVLRKMPATIWEKGTPFLNCLMQMEK